MAVNRGSTHASVLSRIWRLVLPIYLPSFLSAIARGGALLIIPLYALEIAAGPALAGLVVGLRAGGTMVADVPAGILVAKWGDKKVMLVGLGVLSGTAVLLALAKSGWTVVLGSLVLGIGGGMWILARLAYVTERVPLEHRGRVIAVMGGLERAGVVVGPFLCTLGVQWFGYSLVFVTLAGCFGLAFVLCVTFTQASIPVRQSRQAVRLNQVLFKHWRPVTRVGTIMVMLSFLRNGRQLILPVWGVAIGLVPSQIGLIVSLAAIVDLVMFLPAGLILDHLGRRAALVPCLVCLGVSFLCMPLATSYWTFLAIGLLAGLGNGFGTGIFMTLGADLSPRFGRGQFLGIWRLYGDSGGTAGPLVIGELMAAFSMTVACLTTGGLGLVAALATLFAVPEPTGRRQNNATPGTITSTR